MSKRSETWLNAELDNKSNLTISGYETPPNNGFVRQYGNCQRDDNGASTSRENIRNGPKCNLGATNIKDHIIQVIYAPRGNNLVHNLRRALIGGSQNARMA
ncbi:hypothetical protein L798_07768 [Zootermopsis nevadensis]|uniref:Uncharacterized protein n=1 Tax=Zootermopsis nevadensis TaxID=136037 RepID=A0A067RGW8_ZOONE|nr:hypothetical protein L798_07768 [Zootermopsis nevadensis]